MTLFAKKNDMEDIKDKLTIERADLLKEPNLSKYTAFLKGFRIGYVMSMQNEIRLHPRKKEENVYRRAEIDFLIKSLRNVHLFVEDRSGLRYTDHKRDEKGRLVSCRLACMRKVVRYEEV